MGAEHVDLGQWPILQFAAAILTLAGIGYTILRGSKDRGRREVLPSEQRWFFDGPLAEALRYMRENAKAQEQILLELRPIGEAIRNQNRILEDIKDSMNSAPSRRRRPPD